MGRELNSLVVVLILNIFTNVSVLATGNQVYGSAHQSSTYQTCSAEKAFDGVKIYKEPETPCTCSVTAVHEIPRWWEIKFGSMYLIGSIIVSGREDRDMQSTNLAAFISNNTMKANIGTLVNSPTTNTFGLQVRLDPPRVAQYINIKKEDYIEVMTICEVEVYETNCSMGYFGDKCLRRCHCQSPCDVVTGNCHECEPGWYPPTCESGCSQGFYGQNCSKECSHNCKNDSCNSRNGSCLHGCKPGYDFTMSTLCSVACTNGDYGTNCSKICGKCRSNDICDKVSGICPNDCAMGFQGTTCSAPCENGFFGYNCSSPCHCNGSEFICDMRFGNCSRGCSFGYEGINCSIALVEVQSQNVFPYGEAVGGLVGATFGVAFIVGAFFLHKRRFRNSENTQSNKTYENEEFSHPKQMTHSMKHDTYEVLYTKGVDVVYSELEIIVPRIKIYKLWDYIRKNKQNECQHFNEEFAKLPVGLVYKHEVAAREENKGKNRYKYLLAYDHSRVPLQKIKDDDCDYINANYIDGYRTTRKFIATQGPTKSTIDDFWQMVWQEKAQKIVMLTNLVEMATMKCLQYWPDLDHTCSFGGLDISVEDGKVFKDFEIRTLIAKKGQSSFRRIQQYHFNAWPDKNVPDNGWCIVEFWNAVETQSASAPIIVLCSSGVGRTGTFIALDNLIDQAKTEKCVQPLQVVKALRRQRVNMVQTKEQYIYLHDALAEALLMGTIHVWQRQFENFHRFMVLIDAGESDTRLARQFYLIEKSLTNDSQRVLDEPVYGNLMLSEVDTYHRKHEKPGADYIQKIGVISLPSYSGKNTFLVCKSPSNEQLDEFWSFVEKQHIISVITHTIVPSLTHTDGKYLTTVKQFECTDWHENETLPAVQNMLDCLDAVRKWQEQLDENKPILIICETGHDHCGLVAALLNEIYRMEETGGKINIVETVKTMKQRHKNIIAGPEQYMFIHDAVLKHVQNRTVIENL